MQLPYCIKKSAAKRLKISQLCRIVLNKYILYQNDVVYIIYNTYICHAILSTNCLNSFHLFKAPQTLGSFFITLVIIINIMLIGLQGCNTIC